MRARVKALLLFMATALGAGVGIVVAVQQSITVEGFNCGDWAGALTELKGTKEALEIYQLVKPSCPGLQLPNECSILPGGDLCFRGHRQGGTTNIANPANAAAHRRPCSPAVGTPVPCLRDDYVVWDPDPDLRVINRRGISDSDVFHGIKTLLDEIPENP